MNEIWVSCNDANNLISCKETCKTSLAMTGAMIYPLSYQASCGAVLKRFTMTVIGLFAV